MTQRIADPRTTIKTLEDADELMRQISALDCQIAVENARTEKRITAIKAKLEEKTAPLEANKTALEAQLSAYIITHKDQFKRPKKRKTPSGEYGLRHVTDLIIDDPDALTEHLLEAGYDDCLKTTHSPHKAGIKARLENNEQIPHAAIRTGDTVVCIPSKALVKQAIETL